MSTPKEESNGGLRFNRNNYILMALGLGLLVGGFVALSGGGTDNPNEFNEAIFSSRRITLAPLMILAGFLVFGLGIMKRFKA
jgi:spore maturation protein SpmA